MTERKIEEMNKEEGKTYDMILLKFYKTGTS